MRRVSGLALALLSASTTSTANADLTHKAVAGNVVPQVRIGETEHPWETLTETRTPGVVTLRFEAKGDAVEIPHCNGRGKVTIDGAVRDAGSKGTLVLPLGSETAHDVRVEVNASAYERRIACAYPPKVGTLTTSTEGLTKIHFTSPHAKKGGGEAVVFVPARHDPKKPGALLVGVHPWNGGPFTYAAYKELLEEAQAKDVVLLMPSGLGNSLYVEEAEDEVMLAIDAVAREVAVDRQRVSIWGASMGGAGATTISFHRPDRFAFVASYFGDSKYDLTTYVKNILGGEAGARKVNALDVVENARHLPVFLVHGEDDRTSPIAQSTMLFDAMKKAGFAVEFERVPKMAHEGPLVTKYIKRVVDRAADAQTPRFPSRVSFRSVRSLDTQAYGVRIVRTGGDAFVDIEKKEDGVHVLRAEMVSEIVLKAGALGARQGETVHGARVPVRWEP